MRGLHAGKLTGKDVNVLAAAASHDGWGVTDGLAAEPDESGEAEVGRRRNVWEEVGMLGAAAADVFCLETNASLDI